MRGALKRLVDGLAGRCLGLVEWPPLFWGFGALFTLYVAAGVYWLHSLGGSDYWDHLAHFMAFARNPWRPGNPFVATDQPTHLLTPYHLAVGLAARALGVHPIHLLPVLAAGNMVLFLWAVRRVARHVLGAERLALALALTMLLLWNHPWAWSGFYNLGLLPMTAVYPSWFAFGVALHVLASQAAYATKSWWTWSGLAMGTALVGLVHPVTAAFLVVGLLAQAWAGRALWREARGWAVVFGVALLAAALWPYFPVLKTIAGVRGFGEAHFEANYAFFNERLWSRIAPALLGLGPMVAAVRRRERSFVVVGFLLCATLFAVNQMWLHLGPLARFVTYVVLFLHWGVAMGLADARNARWGAWYVMAWAVLLLVCVKPEALRSLVQFGPVRAALRFSDMGPEISNRGYYKRCQPYGRHIPSGAVVLADPQLSFMLAGLIGCRGVAVIHSNPFFRDYQERMKAVQRFLALETPWREREKILQRYAVDFVMVDHKWQKQVGAGEWLTPVFADDWQVLYRVPAKIPEELPVGEGDG